MLRRTIYWGVLVCGLLTLTLAGHARADFKAGLQSFKAGDFAGAEVLWKKSAAKGDPQSQFNLGTLLLSGALGRVDIKSGVGWIQKSSQSNFPEAQYVLGVLYYTGKLVPKDDKLSYENYLRAAKNNHVLAQHNVGTYNATGTGVPQNYSLAAEWFERAGNNGMPDSQYQLGILYLSGRGVAQDYVKAKLWLTRAGESNHPLALYQLGRYYLDGVNGEYDFVLANSYLLKAFDLMPKNPDIALSLGKINYLGLGTKKNLKSAYEYFETAAGSWDREAQFSLGIMYLQGEHVEKDLIQAHKWLNISASGGHLDAHFYRALVASRLNQEQISEAQKLAQTWFDNNHDQPHKHYDLKPHTH